MNTLTAKIRELQAEAARDVASAERDIVRLTDRVRGELDQVLGAVAAGQRVPTPVSSNDVVASTARDLDAAIAARQAAYDRLGTYDRLLQL